MFDVTDSLKINNIDMHPYITEATFGYYDTWGEDSGYTMSNKFVGTFKGTIPKIKVTYGKKLTKEQIIYLTNNILRQPFVMLSFMDSTGVRKTLEAHKGDYSLSYTGINKHKAFTQEYVGNNII